MRYFFIIVFLICSKTLGGECGTGDDVESSLKQLFQVIYSRELVQPYIFWTFSLL